MKDYNPLLRERLLNEISQLQYKLSNLVQAKHPCIAEVNYVCHEISRKGNQVAALDHLEQQALRQKDQSQQHASQR